MKFEVSHRTTYHYSEPVVHSQHLVHLAPRQTPLQSTEHHSLIIEPAPTTRFDGVDAFGNPVTMLEIEVPHENLVLHARSRIETRARASFNASLTTPWDQLDEHLDGRSEHIALDVVQFRCHSPATRLTSEIHAFAAQSFIRGRPVTEAAIDLAHRVFDDFVFDPTATDVATPVAEVLRRRRGVCQDFAHLTLAALRSHRIPCRYVSGYILTHPPPGQPRLQGADASHAWISVWSPELGWTGIDPTNGKLADEEHVVFAEGREYGDVSPIAGVLLGGGGHGVNVAVDVVPVG